MLIEECDFNAIIQMIKGRTEKFVKERAKCYIPPHNAFKVNYIRSKVGE